MKERSVKRIPVRARVVEWGFVFRLSFRKINTTKVVPGDWVLPLSQIFDTNVKTTTQKGTENHSTALKRA